MLMQIGPVQFTVNKGLNTDQYTREAQTDYASKAVVGARPILEWVGEGVETLKIGGKILPKRIGGAKEMAALDALRKSGVAQLVVRGDGKVLGWHVIKSLSQTSTYLDPSGVGQVIEFELNLEVAEAPSASSYVTSIFRLF